MVAVVREKSSLYIKNIMIKSLTIFCTRPMMHGKRQAFYRRWTRKLDEALVSLPEMLQDILRVHHHLNHETAELSIIPTWVGN